MKIYGGEVFYILVFFVIGIAGGFALFFEGYSHHAYPGIAVKDAIALVIHTLQAEGDVFAFTIDSLHAFYIRFAIIKNGITVGGKVFQRYEGRGNGTLGAYHGNAIGSIFNIELVFFSVVSSYDIGFGILYLKRSYVGGKIPHTLAPSGDAAEQGGHQAQWIYDNPFH